MTHQTNGELLKKFQASLSWWIGRKLDKRGADIIITEFLSFIPQPEQLEVEIKSLAQSDLSEQPRLTVSVVPINPTVFWSRPEALDFIKKYNLKLKEFKE